MKRKRGKKAQFYILAAAIIIAIIIGLTSVTNYAYTQETPKKFYDLSENINLEGTNIIKYGLYNEKNIDELVQNLTETFLPYLGNENAEIIIITGNSNNFTITTLNSTSAGKVTALLGNTTIQLLQTDIMQILTSPRQSSNGRSISLIFNEEVTQEITLNPGENFLYFLIKEEGTETIVDS